MVEISLMTMDTYPFEPELHGLTHAVLENVIKMALSWEPSNFMLKILSDSSSYHWKVINWRWESCFCENISLLKAVFKDCGWAKALNKAMQSNFNTIAAN